MGAVHKLSTELKSSLADTFGHISAALTAPARLHQWAWTGRLHTGPSARHMGPKRRASDVLTSSAFGGLPPPCKNNALVRKA